VAFTCRQKPEIVKKFGDGLLKFNDEILSVIKKWQDIVQSDDAQQFATFKKRIEQFGRFPQRAGPPRHRDQSGPPAANGATMTKTAPSAPALNKDLEALANVYAERGKRIAEQTTVNSELSFVLTCLGGIALLLVVIGVIIIARSIARPLSAITSTIKRVCRGRRERRGPACRARRRNRCAGARDPGFSSRRWTTTATSMRRFPRTSAARDERSRPISATEAGQIPRLHPPLAGTRSPRLSWSPWWRLPRGRWQSDVTRVIFCAVSRIADAFWLTA